MTDYEVWLTTDVGVRIALLDQVLWLGATRRVNDVGALTLGLPKSFDQTLLERDRMVQVWRAPRGGRLHMWRAYFVDGWRLATQGNLDLLTVRGSDSNAIAGWRIIAYAAGESESSKSGAADDMMKEMVEENLGSSAESARDWSDYVTVQGDLSAGPSLEKRFAWKNLLDRLQNISLAAKEAGTEVWFDFVPVVGVDSMTFDFRTYTGQPGADRTADSAQTVFDQERGNLEEAFLEYEYRGEVTYCYALGQGQLSHRQTSEQSDDERIDASYWGRKECAVQALRATTANGLRDAARARLREGRPKRHFGGRPLDTAGTRFGRDWDVGDKVVARYRGEEFEPIVEAVQVFVTGSGQERVLARLEWES